MKAVDAAGIAPTDPIRLSVAAALAFPDGTMKVAGLRREGARGNLAITRIAGKDYTTLAAIQEMIEKCRVVPRERASGSGRPGEMRKAASPMPQHGSSSTDSGNIPLVAALRIVDRLSGRSPNTSPPNTNRHGATVSSRRSPSRT
ncbi:excisionase [Ancylobacter mangrovi]|uniref:excisionase n=1 Tax=Ancylobacter mangrovi TaxID=2972472 RepID=UPI0021621E9D|nr:excisionase [Ancylobacter mangrovi]MCS0501561.1 excisionase [Ancylobacter mangrovi]